jgi:hypothetical protein
MVREDVVKALITIFAKQGTTTTTTSTNAASASLPSPEEKEWAIGQLLALTLRLLSWSPGGQEKMVNDSAVPLLCRLAESIGFCNTERADAASDTAAAADAAPQSQGDRDRALDCAIAFCNLANESPLRESLVEQGGVRSVCRISNSQDVQTQWRCAATLRYLALSPNNRFRMVENGAAKALINMAMHPDALEETRRVCAAALCSLSKSKSAISHIVAEGAVPTLVCACMHDMLLLYSHTSLLALHSTALRT